ncbi:hypothetical protein EV195_101449 [Tenacibaculum skagerrakense]|uniref:Sulfotransferase family protein n=1 Tax=Tenacibaculum skagerrakense TaxID=186571 RepID=A0A4R2P3G8_9FLAO|nr:hypothetical protein [Tenacibaculum skagerrakense]TCP28285.1 hypothetical protein EV195_101449 [Tenacibaculum skagerrakense]
MIRYIFCINTGRSGSNYLAGILEEVEGFASFHEPSPIMNDKPMVSFLRGDQSKMEKDIPLKIKTIKDSLADKRCYIETNHCFIKGFGWLLPNHIPQEEIGIIFLKRSKKEIVDSFYRVNCTPLIHNGLIWLINPLMKSPIHKVPFHDKIKYRLFYFYIRVLKSRFNPFQVKKVNKPNFMKKFEFKYLNWYVDETYSQAERFKKEFPKIKVIETTIDKLNHLSEFEKIFNFFNVPFTPKPTFFEKINKKTNLRTTN